MDRVEQLEVALWVLLSFVSEGRSYTAAGQLLDRSLVPVDQGWAVLGHAAVERIEGQLRGEG